MPASSSCPLRTPARRTNTFTIYQTVANAKRSSAEWVVEAPSSESGVLPLANFGSVTFTGISATINGTTGPIDSSNWQAAKINMASGSTLEASTSAVTDSGKTCELTVAYQSSGSANSGKTPQTPQHHSTVKGLDLTVRAEIFAAFAASSTKRTDWLWG